MLVLVALAAQLAARLAWAQYPGQVGKSKASEPVLRSVAVVEWIGEEGKPKNARLIPVAVFDQGRLEDGGLYLARPLPLALAGGVEYELERKGRPIGLFDVQRASQDHGSWTGYGLWKPLPAPPKPKENSKPAPVFLDDDRPVLHRKIHPEEKKKGDQSEEKKNGSSPAADPDRPTLHRKDASSDANEGAASSSSVSAPDPDRPTLHRKSEESSAASQPVEDPDRPKLKKSKPNKKQEEAGYSEAVPGFTDPDRPKLKRGKAENAPADVTPSLLGLPAEMRQVVAVSDAKSRDAHPWEFSWANPGDEGKMRAALEQIARDALGLTPPPAKPALPAKGRSFARKAAAAPRPEPPLLANEELRVFELAYGAGATLALSAETAAPPAERKYITLIAQPDLYGNPLVLLKSVTSGATLEESPRLRLIDAVDALADNRGELLFELRGQSQRQFALYRILRGRAERIFVSGGGEFGGAAN